MVLLAEEYLRKGLPQKSRSEFYGKRSSEHRSKAARNAAACIICSAATRRRGTLLAEIIFESKRNVNLLGSSRGGEQAHSCEEPGGLFAACELGNAPLFGAFPDRGGVSLAPPRRWLAEGKTEGLSILPVNLFGSSRGGAVTEGD